MRYALLLWACLLPAQIDTFDPNWMLRLQLETLRAQAESMRFEQAKRNAALVVSQCEHNAIIDIDKVLHARGIALEKTPYGSLDAKFSERVRKALERYEKCSR